MALGAYETLTQALIQAPSSPIPLIPLATLDVYINTARAQVAAEGECVRVYGSLALTPPTQQYPFSAITFPSGTTGVQRAINVRMVSYQVPGAGGGTVVTPREWEFFNTFTLGKLAPVAGPPVEWAQFGQGVNGTIFINLPDIAYTLSLDTACLPIDLVNDTTAEAIPVLWTQAVPFYAAWLGLQSLQRQGDADKMMQRYHELMQRARNFADPSVLSMQYEQAPDPMMANRLGVAGRAGAA